MATLKSALILNDRMTSVLRNITRTLDLCITGLEGVETAGAAAFDPQIARQMHIAIGEANAQLNEMEADYRRAAAGQQNLNRHIQQGVNTADGLVGKIKGLAASYIGLQSVKGLVNLSDEMAQTQARINLMNDGLQSTNELMNMIYRSAQNARGGYMDMAAVVAKFGNNAKDAFRNSQEVVQFSELVQKQMKIGGANNTEASNAMLQLSQALGSGVLRGDELNSIFEQAPNLIQSIADYMGKPIGEIRNLASEGKITASIVKNAMFAAADDINAKFDAIPMTWADVWQRMKNTAQMALEPLLNEINALANNQNAQAMINGIAASLTIMAKGLANVLKGTADVYNFFAEHWTGIAPVIGGITTALGFYTFALGIHKIALFGSTIAEKAHEVTAYKAAKALLAKAEAAGINTKVLEGEAFASACAAASMNAEEVATAGATVAQAGFNTALLACPLTWVVLGVVALIAAFAGLCLWLGKTNSDATNTFAAFLSGIYIVGAWFKNVFGIMVPAVFSGLGAVIGALCYNMTAAFHNAIAGVKTAFYSLLYTAMSVISAIANALNKLPFVDIDVSGLNTKAGAYLEKAAAAENSRQSYVNIGDAFSAAYDKAGGNTAFAEGWKADAAARGVKKAEEIAGNFNFAVDGAGMDTAGVLGNIANTGGKTADNTGSIAKNLDITNEELKWLRDIAEREAINRFTTAEVKIDMTGMTNSISGDADLDGLLGVMTDGFEEAIRTAAKGVH